jgi:hypothetical protein
MHILEIELGLNIMSFLLKHLFQILSLLPEMIFLAISVKLFSLP